MAKWLMHICFSVFQKICQKPGLQMEKKKENIKNLNNTPRFTFKNYIMAVLEMWRYNGHKLLLLITFSFSLFFKSLLAFEELLFTLLTV